VAALSGALGAGLISMVCNLTIGKKGYEQYQSELEKALAESEDLQKKLTELIDKDANAFNGVIAAYKMPKETDEEKALRSAAIQTAYKQAADIPFQIATTCLEVLELGQSIVDISNTNVISDVGIAAISGYAGLECGIMNVNVNLPYIKDETYVKEKNEQLNDMLSRGKVLRDLLCQKVNDIISK
ncbi:MAG: cyclodeaminase/cyclohydrolase family protein, partial [Syntrophomonadaceae bacterium]|nr:cyclodeaminase/cyclohydrolase family protein [Syntrophomonadaceae bacterium]